MVKKKAMFAQRREKCNTRRQRIRYQRIEFAWIRHRKTAGVLLLAVSAPTSSSDGV